MERGGIPSSPLHRISLILPLLLLSSCQAEETPLETDPLYSYVMRAEVIRLDPGTAAEVVFRGDSLESFLDPFQPDPFQPGPRAVRIESACRPASITIEGYTYQATLCTLLSGSARPVFSVGLDTTVVRLIGRW